MKENQKRSRSKFRAGDILGFKCADYRHQEDNSNADVCLGIMLTGEEYATSENGITVYYFRACKHHHKSENELGIMHLMAKSHFLVSSNEDNDV